MTRSASSVIRTLLPTLIQSAHYAKYIQKRVAALEEKQGTNNLFAAALSDGDLSIQTHIELSILSNFPEIPFFGEEWKSSRNTKYLTDTWFIDGQEYLITLDPIDGTRIYLDGGDLYQIILNVISRSSFEASIAIYPCFDRYVYAEKERGAITGTLSTPIEDAKRYSLKDAPSSIYISSEFADRIPILSRTFNQVTCPANYSKFKNEPYTGAILLGGLSGMILHEAQIIDGAALSFIAREMGFVVQTLNGDPIPEPGQYRDLILPDLIVGRDRNIVEILTEAIK